MNIVATIVACSVSAFSLAGPLDSAKYRERVKAERSIDAMPLVSAPGVYALRYCSPAGSEASSRWIARRTALEFVHRDLAIVLYGDWFDAHDRFTCDPHGFTALCRAIGLADCSRFLFEIPPTRPHELTDALFLLRSRVREGYCVRPCFYLR